MEIEEIKAEKSKKDQEYLVISDINSKVLLSTNSYQEAKSLSSKIAQAGGASTIFKAIK